ncbi:MAG: SpoIIE family protein phosphatase [Spirochaetales bacterium]|nr:SpoIIE family protein phosphatase [Spirochaetales bacterium]
MTVKGFFGKLVGGIRRKIFFMIVGIMGLMTVAFMVLLGKVRETFSILLTINSFASATQVSGNTVDMMVDVVEHDLTNTATLEAYVIDNLLQAMQGDVILLADYASEYLADPEDFSDVQPIPADKVSPGQLATQILLSDNVSISDPMVKRDLSNLRGMVKFMESLYGTSWLDSCIIATPNGVTMITDQKPETRMAEKGVIRFNADTRPWYKRAVDSGWVGFTDVEKDYFSNNIGIVCSAPVYDNEGEVIAVVAADLFMRTLDEAMSELDDESGFLFIISQNGQVIYSPKTEGLLEAKTTQEAVDLRTLGNDFSDFIEEILDGKQVVRKLELEGKTYYMSGARMPTLGWACVTAAYESVIEEPKQVLSENIMNMLFSSAENLESALFEVVGLGLFIITIIFVIACLIALLVSGHISRPLMKMAKNIQNQDAGNLDFVIDKAYLTHDEIEVLALEFKDLSDRTKDYINQITNITAEKERIGAELNVATQIQADMLPSIFPPYPNIKDFDIYATMHPAREVGGDFYDFFMTDGNHIALVMADVSGKGVPAALFMVIAKTLIKNRALLGGSPAEVLKDVNNRLCDGNKTQFFVTVWFAIIDLRTGKGVACNAGHEHPALRRADGKFELVVYKHSPVLGMMEDIDYDEHEFTINRGDTLFVYTDGVPEATDASERMFGDEKLIDALNINPSGTPEELIGNVAEEIRKFVNGVEQFDDITMLCFRYNDLQQKELNDMDELEIDADLKNLEEVLAFVDSRLEERDCPMPVQVSIDVAVEELFVNIAHYAYLETPEGKGKAWIRIGFRQDPTTMVLTLIDKGTPFDPVAKPDPDVTLKAEDRKIGGLGIYMVKKSMDSMVYERRDDMNILTITKKF